MTGMIRMADYLAGIKGKYISLWGYENGQNYKLDISENEWLEKGKGYWIYLTEDGIVVP